MAKIKKEDLVEELITSNVGWTEDDRGWLMECNTDRLQRMLTPSGNGESSRGTGKGPGAGATDEEEESGNCDGGKTSSTLGGKGKKKKMMMNDEDAEDSDDDINENDEDSDEDLAENDEDAESAPSSRRQKHKVIEDNDDEETDVESFIEEAPEPIREVLRESVSALNMEKQKLVSAITSNARCKFTKNQLKAKPISELRQIAMLAVNNEDYEGAQGEAPTNNSEEDGLPLPAMNFEKPEKRRKTG